MRRILVFICVFSMAFTLISCGRQSKISQEDLNKFNSIYTDENLSESEPDDMRDTEKTPSLYALPQMRITLYFYDEKNNQLSPEVRTITGRNDEGLTQYIIKQLIKGPEASGLGSVISPETKLNKVEYAEDIITVDLSPEFLESNDLIVARAALVNSLLELGTHKYVKLYVEGKELTESKDNNAIIGLLTRYPVSIPEIIALEAKSNENTAVRKISRELYFQDLQGMYLLPEVRTINVANNQYAQAIVDELIKGPYLPNQGFYPVMPKGTVLNNAELIKGTDVNDKGVALYFSKEFRNNFSGGSAQELAIFGSLVYSLTSLPDTNFVKVYYDNGSGEYIDEPIHSMTLDQKLTINQFPDMLGKRVRVYFGDQLGMLLVPEYRAISKNKDNIANRIIEELSSVPSNPASVKVMPEDIAAGTVVATVEGKRAVVNLPGMYFENTDNASLIRDLYAIVNSLTDPINMCNVTEVMFTVEGKTVDSFKDISLKDPFVNNPALVKEQ